MESKTKSTFSQDILLKLVHAHFGSEAKILNIHSLDDGWFNTAYGICFESGLPDAVLRIAPHPGQRVLTYEKDLMRRELEILKLLDEFGEGIPHPRVLASDTSRTVIDRDYMFVERYSGTPFNKLPENRDKKAVGSLLTEVGRITARIHAIEGASFGYGNGGPGGGSNTWKEALLEILSALLKDAEDLSVQLELSPGDILHHIFLVADIFDEITIPSMVHWDLWGGNLFVVEDSDRLNLEGIIDWERALWADPEFETVLLLNVYGDPFIQGYGKELLSGPSAEIRHCIYRLYLWLVMVIEDVVRFEDADHIAEIHQNLRKDLALLKSF